MLRSISECALGVCLAELATSRPVCDCLLTHAGRQCDQAVLMWRLFDRFGTFDLSLRFEGFLFQ